MLRPYQLAALQQVDAAHQAGHRAVCLVSPTGSGKTIMGVQYVVERGGTALWLVHRVELLRQSAAALAAVLPAHTVGIIAPHHDASPHAPIQVATVQTLLARDQRPTAATVVLDEAHHYVAEDWSAVNAAYPDATCLGLTATPQRRDGRPLGDLFTALVVAARYPDLVAAGHLVPCRVFQPTESIVSGVAQHPLAAYQRYGDGGRAFIFCQSIDHAELVAADFTAAGVTAACVSQRTKKNERRERLDAFRSGALRVLTNVYALTEGVDVPSASVCILARPVTHEGPYLQMVGRVLRPAPDKSRATVIDLCGATLAHGLPTEDRDYSLDGQGITRVSADPVRQCTICGAVFAGQPTTCPACGSTLKRDTPPVRIYSLELREAYQGQATPDDHKHREYQRLLGIARSRDWSVDWVVKEYRLLFSEAPPWLVDLPVDEKRRYFDRLVVMGRERGHKPGFPLARYHATFGTWPPAHWRREARAA